MNVCTQGKEKLVEQLSAVLSGPVCEMDKAFFDLAMEICGEENNGELAMGISAVLIKWSAKKAEDVLKVSVVLYVQRATC